MRKENIETRIRVLKQRLQLMTLYESHFKEVLGMIGYVDYLNETLDKLKLNLNQLSDLETKDE